MQDTVRQKVDQLVTELKHLFDARLVSVCVYGSAVFQETLPELQARHQDINVLVILKGLEYSDLEKASSIGKWWQRVGHALPMFLSEDEWHRSADVFALEYADIRDTHHVVYGEDLYTNVQVDKEALRLVCELELHRKLIFLRQRLLIHRDKPQILLEQLQSSVNSFAALFRGVLRLSLPSDQVPQKPASVFEAMQGLVTGYEATPFLRILHSKEAHTEVRPTDVVPLYSQFVSHVSRVTAYVDDCFGFLVVKEGVRS